MGWGVGCGGRPGRRGAGAAGGGGWCAGGSGDEFGLASVPAWPTACFGERGGGVYALERGVGGPGVALAAAGGLRRAGAGAGRVPDGGGGGGVYRCAERRVLRAEGVHWGGGVVPAAGYPAERNLPAVGDYRDGGGAARSGDRRFDRVCVRC